MNAAEFFDKARGLDKRIRELEEQIEKLRAKAETVTPSYKPRINGGTRQDRYDSVVLKLEAEEEVAALEAHRQAVIDTINAVRNRRQLDVLWLYYVDTWTAAEIAKALQISQPHVWRVRAKALEEILIPAEYRSK